MENEKVANKYKLKIVDDIVKSNKNPFNSVLKFYSDEVKINVEDIRYYYGGLKKGFDYLMEE